MIPIDTLLTNVDLLVIEYRTAVRSYERKRNRGADVTAAAEAMAQAQRRMIAARAELEQHPDFHFDLFAEMFG